MGLPAATALAIVASGAPSTTLALLRREEPLASTRAVGSVLVGPAADPALRLAAGALAHVAISSFWSAVLWTVLPRRHTIAAGGVAGLAIAGLDLGAIGRRLPAIRQLAIPPQLADHLAFGMLVGWARARSET